MMKHFIWGCVIFSVFLLLTDGENSGIRVNSPDTSSSRNTSSKAFQFSFDASTKSYEGATIVDTQILTQVNNYITTVGGGSSQGSSTIDPQGTTCSPREDEIIYIGPDIKGACFVRNSQGQEFFLNANGTRWPLSSPESRLDGSRLDYTVEDLLQSFLKNQGSLPYLWDWKSEEDQIEWLRDQPETWQ